jgi:small-conductance mechanosensitive channel
LALLSDHFRAQYPAGHRFLGKTQAAIVLCLLVPSGLWMARYAETGAVAGMGFALLAIATGACVLLGWHFAVRKNFAEHRRWMWRCYLLLCSAVVLRLIGGLATVTDAGGGWIYPLAAWASWLVPLAAFEIGSAVHRHLTQSDGLGETHSANPVSNLSLPALDISARR